MTRLPSPLKVNQTIGGALRHPVCVVEDASTYSVTSYGSDAIISGASHFVFDAINRGTSENSTSPPSVATCFLIQIRCGVFTSLWSMNADATVLSGRVSSVETASDFWTPPLLHSEKMRVSSGSSSRLARVGVDERVILDVTEKWPWPFSASPPRR